MKLAEGDLVLRDWRECDAPAVYEARQDAETQYWIPFIPRPYTLEDASAYVRADQRAPERIELAHLPHPDGRRRDSVMFSLLPGELR